MQNNLTQLLQEQRLCYTSGQTRSIQVKLKALTCLQDSMKQYENEIVDALYKDLNKCKEEAYLSEVFQIYEEIKSAKEWIKQLDKVKSVKTPLSHFGGKSEIYYEPYGVVLIVSPWNYPFNLSLSPLIGAIACGNCVVLKPSEYAPNCAKILEKILQEVFSINHVAVIQGDSAAGEALLQQKFDYIFFTGSVNVGRIVMQEAAKMLTPVTLELGGKNPCIVEDYKDSSIAKRIVWGKLLNVGQTCTAPDYLLIRKDLKDEFVSKLIESIISLYAPNVESKKNMHDIALSIISNKEYGKIISPRHFKRIISLFEDTKNKLGSDSIIFGGVNNEELLKISPTLIEMGDILSYTPNNTADSKDANLYSMRILHEEIFAPILPIFTYNNLDECKEFIRSFQKPLSLYLFSDDKQKQRDIIESISFGGGCINDCIIHLANNNLPFGGVGNSGMGNYHGKYSAKTFSREKAIYKAPNIDLPLRYPPFNKKIFGLSKISISRKIFGV